ncbi:class I SAM-dependent methyltransferase [Leptolyngbya sp. CCNP1308]|uniref:class I SAM-dependent methyltransferase n=1 Tax=Leptolyngbya sp. CCNP1308 TaxID=3110255 RepID=UPI002B1FB5C2|nr:class I SAM-dependent methyltransferase [Leptolyngbya sp. CCNP1308]MEA5448600.1 class I SAM-dependent methyltransferase [Leptolyngbya sp. CCNP1308]
MLKVFLKNVQEKYLSKKAELNAYTSYPDWAAHEPQLVPPLELMRSEGIQCLEEWYRWAEEWSMLLRVYGGITQSSKVLEIGCGLGRIAFPLRYILISDGSYDGFEICQFKVKFLEKNFQQAYPKFRFVWANIHNTFYNPKGEIEAKNYHFPYEDNSFDIVFAASVFTHMLPDTVQNYFQEAFRVLKPGGRAVFSFFILDNYCPKQPRPLGFSRSDFDFDHSYSLYKDEFRIVSPQNPEYMTAYRRSLIEQFAAQSGLKIKQSPIPGLWSGSHSNWVGSQDVVILEKPVIEQK